MSYGVAFFNEIRDIKKSNGQAQLILFAIKVKE
jgi:hypothetical protein